MMESIAQHFGPTVCRSPFYRSLHSEGLPKYCFRREALRIDQRYTSRITRDQFDVLNEITDDRETLARKVISLVEKVLIPKTVAIAMSYTDEGDTGTHLKNLYDSYELVCDKFGYECKKVTELNTSKGIINSIKNEIRSAGFALIDLTELKVNVLFEFGFADGLGQEFIVTAREGTDLPFDVHDVPTIFWKADDLAKFRKSLETRVRQIAEHHGHLE